MTCAAVNEYNTIIKGVGLQKLLHLGLNI